MPLTKNEIHKLVETEKIMYIATVKKNGNPHIMPLWFVYYKENIYFETDKTTIKFKNIQKLNRISVCFGGKETYIIEGSVKWWTEKDAPLSFRKLLWKKYKKDMDDSFITDNTYIFAIIPEKKLSWHYAPTWD